MLVYVKVGPEREVLRHTLNLKRAGSDPDFRPSFDILVFFQQALVTFGDDTTQTLPDMACCKR